jgi:hypothetical protein
MIKNLLVIGSKWFASDMGYIFGDNEGVIEEVLPVENTDLSVLMKELGVYASTSKARHAGRVGPIPTGYTEFKANKLITLYIWNPT